MFRKLERFEPHILGLMRIIVGVMLLCHGAQKVLGAFGGTPPETPAFVRYLGGGIELFGGALIAVGLLTRIAAFLMSGLMAFAYFMAHAPQGFWPILNQGELAIVYCWLALYLTARGPGAWALDNVLTRHDAGIPAAALHGHR